MTTEILSKIGIGSGLNNSEIIEAIVDAETVAERERISEDKADFENKISAFGVIKSELKTFQLVTKALQDAGPSTHIGSSSSTTTATFTNTGTTDNDDINASLVVSQLAKLLTDIQHVRDFESLHDLLERNVETETD